MACLRRAQQQLAPLVQDAMQATVGGDEPVVEKVVSGYWERFGEDLSTAPDPMVLGLGAIEDDAIEDDTAPPPPRRPPRAAPPEDEEYFADRGYLR